jgi:hypothetical protein
MPAAKQSQAPTIKAVIKTPDLRAEISGGFPGSLPDLLVYVRDRGQRERLLQRMQAEHQRMCEIEDKRAAEASATKEATA